MDCFCVIFEAWKLLRWKSHTCLDWHEGEKLTEFLVWGELSLLLIIELIYFIVLLAGKYDRFYPLRELKGMSF